jgi:hypothetical protein
MHLSVRKNEGDRENQQYGENHSRLQYSYCPSIAHYTGIKSTDSRMSEDVTVMVRAGVMIQGSWVCTTYSREVQMLSMAPTVMSRGRV